MPDPRDLKPLLISLAKDAHERLGRDLTPEEEEQIEKRVESEQGLVRVEPLESPWSFNRGLYFTN